LKWGRLQSAGSRSSDQAPGPEAPVRHQKKRFANPANFIHFLSPRKEEHCPPRKADCSDRGSMERSSPQGRERQKQTTLEYRSHSGLAPGGRSRAVREAHAALGLLASRGGQAKQIGGDGKRNQNAPSRKAKPGQKRGLNALPLRLPVSQTSL